MSQLTLIISLLLSQVLLFVDTGGIEPPLEEPKSSVLPLNYVSIIIGLSSSMLGSIILTIISITFATIIELCLLITMSE